MKTKKIRARCYLRTRRRAWGLTQHELATLIGTIGSTQVCRIENSKRAPKVEVAFACQAIFGLAPKEMFPDAYALVEERVMRNIYKFHLALDKTTNKSEIRKRELLAQIPEFGRRRFESNEEV